MKTLMRNGRDRRSENPFLDHARKERVSLFGTDQRITSGPAATRLHSKAEYMTAPERFADSQIPLAPRAPSIHDPERSSTAISISPISALPPLTSIRLDISGADHFTPLLDFISDELAKIGRRAGKYRRAQVGQPRFEFGVHESGVDFHIELVDDVGGSVPWCTEAEPRTWSRSLERN